MDSFTEWTLISTLPAIKCAQDTFMFEVTKQTLFWGKAVFVRLINRESGFIVSPQQLCTEDWEVAFPIVSWKYPFVNLHNTATESYHPMAKRRQKRFKMYFDLHLLLNIELLVSLFTRSIANDKSSSSKS